MVHCSGLKALKRLFFLAFFVLVFWPISLAKRHQSRYGLIIQRNCSAEGTPFMNRYLCPAFLLFVLTACNAPAPQVTPTQEAPTNTAPASMLCEIGQQITLNISSAAPAGQGCQQGGGQAQSDSVHVFEVIATPDGQKGVKQIQPDSSGVTKVLNQLKVASTAQGCQLTGQREMHVDMPIDNETKGQAQFTYTYNATVSKTGVSGTGQVNYKFINLKDGSVVKPDCAEPLQIGGAS